MAHDDDVSEDDATKNCKELEFKCFQCKKKIVDSIKCYKCCEIFHPKCMEQSANQKSTMCKHEEGNIEKLARELREIQGRNNLINMEVSYSKELLKESQEKNKTLMDNNALLLENIKTQSEKTNTKKREKRDKESKQRESRKHN